jgi:predicted SAM-dependent methyltransferase
MKEVKLNIGSAGRKKEGYINVDWQSIVKPDLEHNLNVYPYPFADSSVDLIEAFHVVEHLDRPFDVLKEFHRILKPGGVLHLKVPHFSRAMTHPEHFHGFDITLPHYFDKRFVETGYFGVDYDLKYMKMRWIAFFHILETAGYNKILLTILKGLDMAITTLANVSLAFCSRIWCYWVGGFDEIEFYFVCKK